jgi:hypothetical protein
MGAGDVPDIPLDPSRTLHSLQRFDYFSRNQSLKELLAVLDAARRDHHGNARA